MRYWLYQWLDEYGINAEWEVDNVFRQKGSIKRLVEMQESAHSAGSVPASEQSSSSILAGSSLDLSGTISCGGYPCLRADIDNAFLQVWHYFDQIVVSEIDHPTVHDAFSHDDSESLMKVRDHIRILLYLRSIGAESWLAFARKAEDFKDEDWKKYARSLKVEDAFDGARHDRTVKGVVKSCRFKVGRITPGQWSINVQGPQFKDGFYFTFYGQERPTLNQIAEKMLNTYGKAAIADVATAQDLTIPLVQPTSVPWIPNKQARKPSLEQVAWQVRLPVFTKMTPADFLKLREDERPAFEEFRKGFRAEIRRQLEAAEDDTSSSAIARNVEEDYIRPGLAEIEQRLKGSRKALIRKSSVSLAIGSSVAVIGAIASVPMPIAGTVMALGSAVPLAPIFSSYIDESTKALPMEELYFLWRLQKRGRHWRNHR